MSNFVKVQYLNNICKLLNLEADYNKFINSVLKQGNLDDYIFETHEICLIIEKDNGSLQYLPINDSKSFNGIYNQIIKSKNQKTPKFSFIEKVERIEQDTTLFTESRVLFSDPLNQDSIELSYIEKVDLSTYMYDETHFKISKAMIKSEKYSKIEDDYNDKNSNVKEEKKEEYININSFFKDSYVHNNESKVHKEEVEKVKILEKLDQVKEESNILKKQIQKEQKKIDLYQKLVIILPIFTGLLFVFWNILLTNYYVFKGIKQYEYSNFNNAIQNFQYALQIDSNYTSAIYYTGLAYIKLENYTEAIKKFNELISIDKNHTNAYFYKGKMLINLENKEDAIKEFERVIELEPNYIQAYCLKGIILFNLTKYDEASKDFKKIVQLELDYKDAYFYKGLAHFYLTETSLAINEFEKVKLLDPNYEFRNYYPASIFYNNGIDLFNNENYQDAILEFNKVIELFPNYISAYIKKGDALLKLEYYDEAIENYNQVLIFDPNNIHSYSSSAIALAFTGKFFEALNLFKKVIMLNPNDLIARLIKLYTDEITSLYEKVYDRSQVSYMIRCLGAKLLGNPCH